MTLATDEPEPHQRHRAHAPWGQRAEPPDKAIAVLLGLCFVYWLALWPLVPALIGSHPLMLEIISGATLADVTVGAHSRVGELPIWFAVIAGVPGSMVFDWVFWWAGRRWGDRSLHLFLGRGSSPRDAARRQARTARLERTTRRFGPVAIVLAYYLPVPNILIYAASGLSGMRLRTFLALDLLGTLLWIGPAVALGYAVGKPAVDVLHRIDHYSTIVTIGLFVVMIGLQSVKRREAPRGNGGRNGAPQ